MELDMEIQKSRLINTLSFIAWKRCRKRTDESGDFYTGILDRFLKDTRDRESQQKLG